MRLGKLLEDVPELTVFERVIYIYPNEKACKYKIRVCLEDYVYCCPIVSINLMKAKKDEIVTRLNGGFESLEKACKKFNISLDSEWHLRDETMSAIYGAVTNLHRIVTELKGDKHGDA